MRKIGPGHESIRGKVSVTSCAVLPQTHLQVSAHLQSYEILRLIKNMMEDHKNRLSEQAAVSQHDESNRPLPAVPSDTEDDADELEEQILRDEALAMSRS